MTNSEIIERLLEDNNGVVTTADVQAEGVSKPTFLDYVQRNGLRKIAHGIYASDDAWPDEFQLLQLQYPKIVFSHESALFLYGISEKEPDPIAVTVPRGYHSANMENSEIKVYRVDQEKMEVGLTECETPTGFKVRCYDMERTLCDMLRSRSTVDYQELLSAIKGYATRKDRNIPQLMRYAKTFRVSNKLKPYLEVLL